MYEDSTRPFPVHSRRVLVFDPIECYSRATLATHMLLDSPPTAV